MEQNKTLLFKYNVDDNGNPISIKVENEQKQVSINGTIQMEFIPDEYNSIVILGNDGSQMYEVFNKDEIVKNTYYVDYNSGTIYFHESQFGKIKIYNYYNRGLQLMGASRIYDEKSITGDWIVKTLQDIIDEGRKALELISTLGNAVIIINKLEQNITTGKILHENLSNDISVATPLQKDLRKDINEANTFRTQLNKDVADGKVLNTDLRQNIIGGTNTNADLIHSTELAQGSVDLIRGSGNEVKLISKTDWSGTAPDLTYTWNHGLKTKNITVTISDEDSGEFFSENGRIVDINNVLIRSDVARNLRVVLSSKYYSGGLDTKEEIISARKGLPSLTDKIGSIDSQLEQKADKTDLDTQLSKKLNKSDFIYNGIKNKPVINNNPLSFADYIYELDKISLSGTETWSYYDGVSYPQFYPSVGMDKNGEIFFSGIAKLIETVDLVLVDGMVKLGTIFHFDISSFEGVPLWGTFLGVNDTDFNDTVQIPFTIKPNGEILIKNLGKGNKYYSRIVLSAGRTKTTSFGHQKIIEHIEQVKNMVLDRPSIDTSFIYFTDLHYRTNTTNDYRRYEQINYMNLLKRELDLTCLVSGGDNVDEYNTQQKAIICKKDFLKNFDPDSLVYCNGNHDLNISNGSSLFVHYSHVKPYINNTITVYGGEDKYYSYTDYIDKKLRIVVLDIYEPIYNGSTASHTSTASDTQLNWIKTNALLGCPSDYDVIVVSHVAPTPDKIYSDDTILSNAYTIRKMFEDFKGGVGDFTSQGARRLACWFSGHEHKDKIVTINGISYVNTLLAGSDEVRYIPQGSSTYTIYGRTYGTEYEFCFDIVSIDRANRKVYLDRVGRVANITGRTRVVSY